MSLPIPEELRDLIQYNPNTGEVLWTDKPYLPVASSTIRGYLQVRYEGKGYKLARVCYFLHHGIQPGDVTHANCVANDFRASNLREIK